VRYPPLLRRSLTIASIVGTVLMVINQGDVLLAGTWSPALLWKVPLTYAVPFIVATWGALGASRTRR
jgi:urea transporter